MSSRFVRIADKFLLYIILNMDKERLRFEEFIKRNYQKMTDREIAARFRYPTSSAAAVRRKLRLLKGKAPCVKYY